MELCKWKDSVSRPQRRVAEVWGEKELALVHCFPDKDPLRRTLVLLKRCPVSRWCGGTGVPEESRQRKATSSLQKPPLARP